MVHHRTLCIIEEARFGDSVLPLYHLRDARLRGIGLRVAFGLPGGNEARVGTRKKPTPRGRGGGGLRAAEAGAQAEASRALIAICSMPYTEAVPVPPETDTAIYCAARQQPISISPRRSSPPA